MGICCVYGCSNRSDRNKKKPGLAFHRFPKDETLKRKWVKAVRRQSWTPTANSWICTEHFEESCINRTYLSGPRLRENAIPTVFPSYPRHLQKSQESRKPPKEGPSEASTSSSSAALLEDQQESLELMVQPKTKDCSVQANDFSAHQRISTLESQNKHLRWKNAELTRRLDCKSKIIKNLRQSSGRLTARISNMTSLLSRLESKHLDDGSALIEEFFSMKAKHSSKKEGRGKEGRASSASCNGKLKEQRSVDSSESQDEIDFGFPSLSGVDKDRNLQCYTSILKRPKSEVITMDELDHLQPELEMLLSVAVVRQRTLQTQIDALSHPQEDLSQDKLWPQKKRKITDNRVSKSMKDLLKARESASKMSNMSSSENETDNSGDALPEAQSPKSNAGKLAVPKNDMSNKFWASVEPYCSDITEENIKELEQLISCCDNDAAGAKIPPVGRHYTERWAEQELAQERSLNSGRHLSNSSDSDTVSLLKKASNLCHDRSPGPLVQRLVSALLEEPSHDSYPQKIRDESETSIFLGKIPLYHTTACFERRIRRELETAGFLDTENNDQDDEILTEIRKCDEELKVVALQNKEHLTRLLEQAKVEMKRQMVRNKIKEVDEKIVSIYKKAVTPKLKKKQLREKKRRQAWKALKERESILSCLDSL